MNKNLIIIMHHKPEESAAEGIVEILGLKKADYLYRAMLFDTLAICLMVPGSDFAIHTNKVGGDDQVKEMLELFRREEENANIKRRLSRVRIIGNAVGSGASRAKSAFDWGFHKGFRQIAVVRSCCPMLTQSMLRATFILLKTHPAVIGPTFGGSYYLFGLSKPLSGIFDGLTGQCEQYLHIRENLTRRNIDLQELELSYEVSSVVELNQLISDIECLRRIGDERTALHTERFIRSLTP